MLQKSAYETKVDQNSKPKALILILANLQNSFKSTSVKFAIEVQNVHWQVFASWSSSNMESKIFWKCWHYTWMLALALEFLKFLLVEVQVLLVRQDKTTQDKTRHWQDIDIDKTRQDKTEQSFICTTLEKKKFTDTSRHLLVVLIVEIKCSFV